MTPRIRPSKKAAKHRLLTAIAACCVGLHSLAAQDSVIPADSEIGKAGSDMQRILLNPMEAGGVLTVGKYRLKNAGFAVYDGLEPKVGATALKFSGEAEGGGAKGDYVLTGKLSAEVQQLGAWVHLAADANVASVGFQVYDKDGEALISTIPADWEGWRWVEMPLPGEFKQAYKQDDKNQQVDLPLNSVNFVWFAQDAGPTSLGVDALVALAKAEEAVKEPYTLEISSASWGEPGQPLTGGLMVNNFGAQPVELQVEYTVQRNPDLQEVPLPDPVLGSDHAQGQPSWIIVDGERKEDDSLTDNDEYTGTEIPGKKEGPVDFQQVIDLGQKRTITGIGFHAGDANWVYKVDLLVSDDGENFTPFEGLQDVTLYKRWNKYTLDVPAPASGRYLKLRHHHDDPTVPRLRTPHSIFVYDGVEDEKLEIPTVGEQLEKKQVTVSVAPRGFELVQLATATPLKTDSYLFGIKTQGPSGTRLATSDYFVMPATELKAKPESRFGMNVSTPAYIPLLQRLGMGWVRFENFKWKFYNPEPGVFRFDGTVKPWVVPHEEYMKLYSEAGFSILPYIFQTPNWATSAGEDVKKNQHSYPPKDYADFGAAIYEVVARFGSNKSPVEPPKTDDKVTGLDLINTYEIWNEPNLNDPGWGFWVGTMEQYLDLFRVGAEAVKKADPKAQVTTAGYAGVSMDWVDKLRSYQYPDGKRPLDFADILNVHMYTGRSEPELNTKDPNAFREGANPDTIQTSEKDLIDLADWRDSLKPEMPIWLTETGYDVGGPIGASERLQAAKLPRILMMQMANGIEKTFIYREKGSTPAQHAGAGLLRNDETLRPSFFTIATLTRMLDGAMDVRVPRLRTSEPGVWMYRWKKASGKDVVTVWTPTGTSKLGVDLGKCKVVNSFGGESEMELGADHEVTIFPIYITQVGNAAAVDALEKEAIEREEKRKSTLVAQADAKSYLFDFGSTEKIGSRKVGLLPRQFTPVIIDDVYTAEKGFGYAEKPPGKDVIRHWVKGALDTDAVHLHRNAIFRIDAEPGTYQLEVKGEGYKEGSQLTVRGGGSDATLDMPEKGENFTSKADVTVTAGQPLELEIPSGGIFQWAALVESTDAAK